MTTGILNVFILTKNLTNSYLLIINLSENLGLWNRIIKISQFCLFWRLWHVGDLDVVCYPYGLRYNTHIQHSWRQFYISMPNGAMSIGSTPVWCNANWRNAKAVLTDAHSFLATSYHNDICGYRWTWHLLYFGMEYLAL